MNLRVGPINAATPTPLTPDGALDITSAKRLCQRWLNLGLDGVFLLGTMGEGLLLAEEVRATFLELALAEAGSRLTIFAGAADLSRARMRDRALRYARMGAHCIVLCLPPNVAPKTAIADVKAVADACPVPCAYYEIPLNTGTALLLDEIRDILAHGNILVFKDSSGHDLIAQGLTAESLRPKGCSLLDGNEYRTAFSAMLGYDGVLHGGGVLTGRWVRTIWEKTRQGLSAEAMAMDREKALFLGRVYGRFTRPPCPIVGQKYALKLLGVLDHETVVADQQLDDTARARIAAAVQEHHSWLV